MEGSVPRLQDRTRNVIAVVLAAEKGSRKAGVARYTLPDMAASDWVDDMSSTTVTMVTSFMVQH